MTIGIIGAMELEVSLLRDALQKRKDTTINQFVFHEGFIGENKVILLLSGIGKVSASVATTLLITHFSPDFVLNTGVAGGLSKSSIYDIVLASKVTYYDVDVTAFGYKLGQQAQMPDSYIPNPKWFEIAQANCLKYTPNLRIGQLVSGDSFVNTIEKKKWIQQNFPEAIAVEMEAAAIAQTCHIMHVPFLIIRSISDNASEGNTDSYETFVEKAGKLSAQINLDFITNI